MNSPTRKDWQNLGKYCKENKQHGWCPCLRIKNIKKQVLEAVKGLFSKVSISTPDAFINRAHCVSRTDGHGDSTLYNISSLHYVLRKKELKNGVKAHVKLTKDRLDLLIKTSKYVNSLSNKGFVYTDINCRLKIHFSITMSHFLIQWVI